MAYQKKYTPKQYIFIELLKEKEWVGSRDIKKSGTSINSVLQGIEKFEPFGYRFETKEVPGPNGYMTLVKLLHEPTEQEIADRFSIVLTPTDSEIVRIMQNAEGFVRMIDVAHVTKAFLFTIRRLEKIGFVFEKRSYDNCNGSHNATECKIVSMPKNIRLQRWNPPKKKEPAKGLVVARCKNCFYGEIFSGTSFFCNYIVLTGHSRGCPPSECTYYEPRKRGRHGRKNRISEVEIHNEETSELY